jgi:hypothetical protein
VGDFNLVDQSSMIPALFNLNIAKLGFFFFLVGLWFELRASHLQTGALPFESHLQPIFAGYFGVGVSQTTCPGWP